MLTGDRHKIDVIGNTVIYPVFLQQQGAENIIQGHATSSYRPPWLTRQRRIS